MDQHTLQILEFHKIRELVAQKTLSPLGRESALAMMPMVDRDKISTALGRVSELKGLVNDGLDLPLRRFEDVRPGLARCRHSGAVLEPGEFLQLSDILGICQSLLAFAKDHAHQYPLVEDLIRSIASLGDVKDKIDQKVDAKGQIRDDASKKLASLRLESQTTRDRILSKLRSLFASVSGSQSIRDEVITLRDGRYVIPVRGDQRHRIQGVVHDRSATGTTLFVEPAAVVDLGNRLRELEIEEKREILKILRDLTRMVAEQAPVIASNLVILQELDLIQAKARLASDLDASLPKLGGSGVLKLRAARHPLLVLFGTSAGKVIPLDVELGERYHTLLVTGPNTGGKTVVLKTLGLLSAMAQAGLLIPVQADSELPIFQKIFADIGDEQSLEQSLSTFSSHLRQIVKVLEQADGDSLVLLDEIGVGTDPEEGAALAMAILEVLTSRSVRTVATTHLGALKVFAHDHPGVENASLEFDRRTLRPTYRFHVGVPGSSYALEIAQRLGIQPAVVERATALLGEDRRETGELIEELNRRVAFYEQKNTELERREAELNQLMEDYRQKLSRVRREEESIREKAYRDAQLVLAEANALIERLVAQIRKSQASHEVIKEAHRALETQSRRVEERLEVMTPPEAPPISLQKGDGVWVESVQAEGQVVARMGLRNRYKIQVGNLIMELDGSDIRPLTTPGGASRPRGPSAGVEEHLTDEASGEIDLRGLTAEEALAKLEKFLDRALLAGLHILWIVHGKGTGVLRRRVGEFLKDFPGVKSYRLGEWNEGGDGVTVVELE